MDASVAPARRRAAAAGAAAAAIWAFAEPVDRRLFRCDYSDVALVGRSITKSGWWWPIGFLIHLQNGALFGIAFCEVQRRVRTDPRRLALGLALAEHALLWPLLFAVDEKLARSPRAFVQGSARHALFGFLLGRLA